MSKVKVLLKNIKTVTKTFVYKIGYDPTNRGFRVIRPDGTLWPKLFKTEEVAKAIAIKTARLIYLRSEKSRQQEQDIIFGLTDLEETIEPLDLDYLDIEQIAEVDEFFKGKRVTVTVEED